MKKEQRFNVGDKVFAKVKGYPAWPAIVLEETGKKYKVKFYGTGEIGQIKHEDLFYYTKNKQRLLKPSKRKDFNDSVEQIEEAIKLAGTDGSPDDIEKDGSVLNDSLNSTTDTESSTVSKKRKRSVSVVKSSEERLSSKSKKGKFSSLDEKSGTVSPVNEEKNRVVIENTVKDDSSAIDKKEGNDSENSELKSGANADDSIEISLETKETVNRKEASNEKNFVTEKELEAFVAFGHYVEKHKEIYSDMSVNERYDSEVQTLPFFSGEQCIGIKFHRVWPLEAFENEFQRALYDKDMAQRAIDLKASFKEQNLQESPNDYIENLEITEQDLSKFLEEKLLAIKEEILSKLKIEESLLQLDTKIKNCLSLDKAEPKEAIILLEEILNLKLTCIMLKKHAQVVDMVRRLRKYIGNIEGWNLTEEEKKTFRVDAEAVRNCALKVYVKFMNIVKESTPLSVGDTFWDTFNDIVTKFREETKEFSEIEYYNLTCEPYSRKNFLNNHFIKNILLTIPLQDNEFKDSSPEKNINKGDNVD